MPPSATRGLLWFALAVVGSALAIPMVQFALWIESPERDVSPLWVSLLNVIPFTGALILFPLPAWRGRRSNLAKRFMQRTPSGSQMLIGQYVFLSATMFMAGVATLFGAPKAGPLGITACAVSGYWWTLSALVIWKSRDVRQFLNRRHALHRLKRMRQMAFVAAKVQTLKAEWRQGRLTPGVSVSLPPLPLIDESGKLGTKLLPGWAGVIQRWQIILVIALRDDASVVCLHPHRSRNLLRCYFKNGTGFVLRPADIDWSHPIWINVIVGLARDPARGWLRWFLPRLATASNRVRLESEFGSSEWLVHVWRVDVDRGVEWHRLDV